MSTVLLHSVLNVVLSAQNGLDYDVVDARPEQVHVNADLLQVSTEGTQRPLITEIILLTVFVFDKLLVFLVD